MQVMSNRGLFDSPPSGHTPTIAREDGQNTGLPALGSWWVSRYNRKPTRLRNGGIKTRQYGPAQVIGHTEKNGESAVSIQREGHHNKTTYTLWNFRKEFAPVTTPHMPAPASNAHTSYTMCVPLAHVECIHKAAMKRLSMSGLSEVSKIDLDALCLFIFRVGLEEWLSDMACMSEKLSAPSPTDP